MRSLLCSCVDLPRKSPKGPFLKSGALLLASRLTLLRQSSSGQEEQSRIPRLQFWFVFLIYQKLREGLFAEFFGSL
jgi:hypothetical protein